MMNKMFGLIAGPLLARHRDVELVLRGDEVIMAVFADVDDHPVDAPVNLLPCGP